jgi:hypothetical protein
MTSCAAAAGLSWLAVGLLAAGCAVTLPQAERPLHLETRLERDADAVWQAVLVAADGLDLRVVAADAPSRLLTLRSDLKEPKVALYVNVYVRAVGSREAALYVMPRVRFARFRTAYAGDDVARELVAGVRRRLEAR